MENPLEIKIKPQQMIGYQELKVWLEASDSESVALYRDFGPGSATHSELNRWKLEKEEMGQRIARIWGKIKSYPVGY